MFKPSLADEFKIRRSFAVAAFINLWIIAAICLLSAAFAWPLSDYVSLLIAIIGADTTIIGYYYGSVHFNKVLPVSNPNDSK